MPVIGRSGGGIVGLGHMGTAFARNLIATDTVSWLTTAMPRESRWSDRPISTKKCIRTSPKPYNETETIHH